MATIAENLQIIKNSTTAIKNAIINKGGTINGDITTYAESIRGLICGGGDALPTANIILNKLNGESIGEVGVKYPIETILYEYTFNNANLKDMFCIPIGYGEFNNAFVNFHTPDGYYSPYIDIGNYSTGYYLSEALMQVRIQANNSYINGDGLKLLISIETFYDNIDSYNTIIPTNFILICINNDNTFDYDFFNICVSSGSCYIKDTQISLYNGLKKSVQDITYNDELLVWNFDEGKFDKSKPLWIKKEEKINNYYKVTLNDGNIISLVGSNGRCHRLFDYDDMIFESATELVGKNVHTLNGIHKVVSVENIKETVEYYNIITNYHMNCFANGVLTSCRFNNLYPIKDMVFDKSNINIEPRWKIHQEKFKPNPEILPLYIRGMRLDENQNISIEEMKEYIINLERRKKTITDFEENFEYSSNIEDTEVGWISPEGEVIGYKLYIPGHRTHEIIAKNICKKKNIDSDNFSKILEQLGFVKYTNTFIACDENIDITEVQEKLIKKFISNNKKIKKRGTIKMNNHMGEDIKIQEFLNIDKKELSHRIKNNYNSKRYKKL